jgi:hypothetical protein
MLKFAATALLLVVFAVPAFAKKSHTPKPSHPQAIHPTNPYLKHHARHKPHPVAKHHTA